MIRVSIDNEQKPCLFLGGGNFGMNKLWMGFEDEEINVVFPK